MEDREGDSLALLELAIEDGLQQIAQPWSANILNTLPDSMSSQVTAAEESSSPKTSYDVENPGTSPSSSNTLVERSPEARSGSRRGLQFANQLCQRKCYWMLPRVRRSEVRDVVKQLGKAKSMNI